MTSELKEIIHESILNYLHINGFPKTLKRFQSEAQIQVFTNLYTVIVYPLIT